MASRSPASPLSSTPSPRRARRKEARPGELIEAALDLFVERGYAATKVDEVAARAGVSKGTLFLYFPSKEDLFKAVARHNLARHFTEWDVEIEHYPHSTSELLRYAYELWWEHIGATKASAISKLVLSEAHNFPDIAAFYRNEVVLPGNRLIRRILERGMQRGEFRKLDLDCAVHVVAAPLVFMMMWRHSGVCMPASDEVTPQRFIDAQVDSLLAGFCVRQDAPAAQPRAKRAVRAPKMDGLS
ncbi:TetR/AcrR family transcriptional regulator [Paracidovorax citrulli]|uniref:Transcriptional regulator, TetR family n=2 Tax=Paracidovorax citrulli TaxID=80869 RepID=A1TQZ5_PARC0|nr:TetR/AcrR family transcriptional regulator [Paracidovorax citrulli]ABM33383.1 transcriptional regulator, TetR family [Paracidovorax citrulli AAC00-1]ATG92697.1 TetR/AcrR family transcriptional regulator [Paracidovorax citrulli]PVY62819.1 TetR family transcriptional regulator [Paracidovorax citrulli]REG68196.1 TetR family transcriptional regulator [Paracidovorax citrulli]RLJ92756.1 TetR family transcriptional regulator [Paracidovorax citrulli]